VGGAGVEYRFASHWAAQVEMRYYYSTVSTQKDYMRNQDPHYNGTLALQAGIWYCF
jgi:opacity protein-like surface antigen